MNKTTDTPANKTGKSNFKIAIIHYWLVGMRGGEKVLEELLELYPEADVYTHVIEPSKISEKINNRVVGTTFIGKLPKATKHYQKYLPLMPHALEQLDLREYDLIVSSESGPAKGVITSPDALHICYCHSPMRYLWDMTHQYTEHAGTLKKIIMQWLLHRLRLWDLASSSRVDHFIANSNFIARRIQKFYRRESLVIYPPVDISQYQTKEPPAKPEDFYLMVGQLVKYKNTDRAVRVFNKLGKRLIVIGAGEELNDLRTIADKNVELLGYQSDEMVKSHYKRCKALIFPGTEDFGMVPVEVMAAGRPVIALGRGGALDTVIDNITGITYEDDSDQGLESAILRFEAQFDQFNSNAIQTHAKTFDKAIFRERIRSFIEDKLSANQK